MIEIAIATSLIHPNLFGAAWAILILVCLARLVATWGEGPLSGTGGEALRLWGLAFGPLFLLSAASVWSLGLGVGRIEVLEILAGGAVLALGLSRFKSAAHPRFQFVSLAFHQSMVSRGALIALIAGLLLALYELLIAGERRAGMVFQPINFGIGCGVALLLALFLTEQRSRIFVFSMAAGAIALLLSGSRYLGSQPWPFPASVMIAYEAVISNSDLVVADGQEIEEIVWLTREDLKSKCESGELLLPPIISVARAMINAWYGPAAESELSGQSWRN